MYRRLTYLAIAITSVSFVTLNTLQADDVVVKAKATPFTVLLEGKIHEAFATPECYHTDDPFPAPKAPPGELVEAKPTISSQLEKMAVWIPGYWEWNEGSEKFIWTTGVWRFPPPNRRWVPGQWTNTEDGFVRSHGHWIPNKVEIVAYVSKPPRYQGPFLLQSSLAKDHFWVPGYWTPAEGNQFAWRDGFVAKRAQNWEWIAAQYFWTPKGWVFIDGYWDYPVGARGQAFAALKLGDGPYDAEQVRVQTFAPIPNTAISESPTGDYVYSLKELDEKYEFVSVDSISLEAPEAPVVAIRELPARPTATVHGVIHRGELTPSNIEVELIGFAGDTARITKTNEQGQFVFSDVPFGVYYVRAHGPVQNHIKRAYGKLQVADATIAAKLELH